MTNSGRGASWRGCKHEAPGETVRQAHRLERCRRTGMRSLGTDTLHRVRAWCLSPSVQGQAPSRTTEPVPERAASLPVGRAKLATRLTAARLDDCSRTVMNHAAEIVRSTSAAFSQTERGRPDDDCPGSLPRGANRCRAYSSSRRPSSSYHRESPQWDRRA